MVFVTHSVFETRLPVAAASLVMAARPGRVIERPRRSTRPIRATTAFAPRPTTPRIAAASAALESTRWPHELTTPADDGRRPTSKPRLARR